MRTIQLTCFQYGGTLGYTGSRYQLPYFKYITILESTSELCLLRFNYKNRMFPFVTLADLLHII